MRRRGARGWTLIELMIVVAMLGVGSAAAWSTFSLMDAPGSAGFAAARVRAATALLANAQQESLLEPLVIGEVVLPAQLSGMTLRRTVTEAGPGLLRVRIEASWPVGQETQRLALVSAKVQP